MKFNPLYFIYQWLIAMPLIVVVTALVAILTSILSPLFPNCDFSYWPARFWGRFICYVLFIRVKTVNMDQIDFSRSYVIAANHQSIFDIFAIYGWLPNIFKWIMKAELRRIPLVGHACQSAGHIFIDRTHPIAARKSLERAENQLKNGVSVVIFPEGTRTKTGLMGKFKKGAFLIATDLHLPILPITIKGSYERVIKGSFNFRPGTIEMIFHQPVDVNEYLPDNTQELIEHTRNVISGN